MPKTLHIERHEIESEVSGERLISSRRIFRYGRQTGWSLVETNPPDLPERLWPAVLVELWVDEVATWGEGHGRLLSTRVFRREDVEPGALDTPSAQVQEAVASALPNIAEALGFGR